jgi:UDP-glucose 4-epimerase
MGAERPSRVLVTGGTGFIGRRAVRAFPDGRRAVRAFPGASAGVTMVDLKPSAGPGVRAAGDPRDPAIRARAVSPGTSAIGRLAALGLGYQPTFDITSGLGTVWPEFAPSAAAEREENP